MVFAGAPVTILLKSPSEIRLGGLAGSIPVIVELIFHQEQRCVEPTKIAAQENAGELGFLGSLAQELVALDEFFSAERIPINSVPEGALA